VLVADVGAPTLDEGAIPPLGRVLRLTPGAMVTATDGRGSWRPTVWTGSGLEPAGEVIHVASRRPAVGVGVALVKAGKPELVVQKLTEIGVDRIVFFAAERSVVRWDDTKATKVLERLGRVAREALAQCRRVRLPEVTWSTWEALVAEPGVALAEPGASPPTGAESLVLVGPEGGWSPAEAVVDVSRLGLGPHVLRAETAAIVAGTLLVARRHGLLRPPATG
jgi:16S rRNA (uracil1498-N3)-methyltransferase